MVHKMVQHFISIKSYFLGFQYVSNIKYESYYRDPISTFLSFEISTIRQINFCKKIALTDTEVPILLRNGV